jgi:hypothetical protein
MADGRDGGRTHLCLSSRAIQAILRTYCPVRDIIRGGFLEARLYCYVELRGLEFAQRGVPPVTSTVVLFGWNVTPAFHSITLIGNHQRSASPVDLQIYGIILHTLVRRDESTSIGTSSSTVTVTTTRQLLYDASKRHDITFWKTARP